ncbi:MAG: YkgJ family cysteine cluster protein [Proteobacteria bacterium]|nr:YkgJ family cysteine cluster protein [Pseudomonadota bacterium]MBU4472132.1 YkgJ family cysteine cluster protein [Pseudomonadota bacterium]MCG2752869.1 YkgJ family cysteine cluster protein [Desulfobacteraceae bacterium]
MTEHSISQGPETLNSCTKCGTCCKKGGPAFHNTDASLIESGAIPIKFLFTLRQGEPAYDNVKDCIVPVETDIVKIKSRIHSATCLFFEEKNRHCGIYEKRPLECRVLKCWDTGDIVACYAKDRLTRKDLMGNINGLWDMVKDHQETCALPPILEFVENLKSSGLKDPQREKAISETIAFDLSIRALAVEKGNMDPEMLDFLFGRSLPTLLESLGLCAIRQNGKLIFKVRQG